MYHWLMMKVIKMADDLLCQNFSPSLPLCRFVSLHGVSTDISVYISVFPQVIWFSVHICPSVSFLPYCKLFVSKFIEEWLLILFQRVKEIIKSSVFDVF